MAADTLVSAILQYVDHGAYPESEEVASAELGPDAVADLLAELRKAQDEVQNEIRTLSRDTAPDIDTWISQAKKLQGEIQRSRETARQIVADAEAVEELRAKVEDAGKKVALLEKEVNFNATLVGTLEHMKYVGGLLDDVQDEAVKGNVQIALDRLDDVEASLGGLQVMQNTRAYDLLQVRAKKLKENLVESATEFWNAFIDVSQEEKRVIVRKEPFGAFVPGAEVLHIGLDVIVMGAKGLGIFDSLVQKLGRDIDRAILRPRLVMDQDGQVGKATITDEQLSCARENDDTSCLALFPDLEQVLHFLATRLPPSISILLSETLIPALSSRLEEHWLEPAVPLEILEMPAFQDLLANVLSLASLIDRLGWRGSKQLRDWVQSAPRIWLTKRREAILGMVRNLVFVGLRDMKVVERVETQMVTKGDGVLASVDGTGDDEWDTAWDDAEEQSAQFAPEAAARAQQTITDKDDDNDEGKAWDAANGEHNADENGTEGEEAWGWDEEEATKTQGAAKIVQPAPPTKVNGDRSSVSQAAEEREVTLRETFTVTFIPDSILSNIKSIISDAETLADAQYASSPIAPAATALYTLPTLALAIYRATAPTVYSKLATGNMLIYNDSLHLASQLRAWQALQPHPSRLRLDSDVQALESFAKRAYSAEMESQRTILKDLLDGAQGFSHCTEPPFKAECESAVDQTVDRLREVNQQWNGILSQSALLQSLGSLLATVTGKMITEIEDLGDISEPDSHQLRQLMDRVATITTLFHHRRPLNANANQEGSDDTTDMTFIYCPNWLKFQYLAEILESSLADIKYLWNEGELSLEFEVEEVVELIEALFAETDLRRRAIGEIRRGGRR